MAKPKIRFKGYTDDWEQRKLGDICSRVQGNDGRMELPTLTISAGNGWMNQEDRFSGNIAGKEQKNYTLLKRGELSYNHGNSKLAKYGTVFSLQTYEEALVPRVYHSFKVEKGNANFVEYYFATKLPDRELGKLISSGARMDGLLNIGYDDFMGISLLLPKTQEQDCIAGYFRKIDMFITLHQRKCEETKKLKKYMLQKMFPQNGQTVPEIRFAGFTDAWEQRKLEDLVDRVTRKNQDLVSELPLTISAQYGLIDQNEFFDKRVASKDVSGYYLIENGEFAYNKSTSTDAPWGAVKRLDRYENGVLSTLYIVFGIKKNNPVDSDFLVSYYSTNLWHKGIHEIAAEGARNHGLLNIAPADFFETELTIPQDIEEQKKIGKYFEELERLITLHQCKCRVLPKLLYNDWEQRKLGETCKLNGRIGFRGYTERDIVTKEAGGVLTFSPTNIVNNKLTMECKNTYITREKYDESPEIKIANGDILFVKTGSTLGKSALVTGLKEDASINPQIVVVRVEKDSEIFMSNVLITHGIMKQVAAVKIGGAVPTMTETELKNLTYFAPVKKEEQKKIGDYFTNLDHFITLHHRKYIYILKSP